MSVTDVAAPTAIYPAPSFQIRGVRLARTARLENRSRADNVIVAGRLDERILGRAVAAMVARHQPLRTMFPADREPPVAAVLPVSDHVPVAPVEGGHTLSRELAACYQASVTDTDPALPPLGTSFERFALAHRVWLTATRRAELVASWRPRLPPDAPDPRLDLPALRAGSERTLGPAGLVERGATGPLITVLSELRRRNRASNFVILLAGLLASIRVLTGRTEVGALFPVDVRARYGAQHLVGRFANLAVIWLAVRPNTGVAELVAREADHVRGAVTDAEPSFGELARAVYPDWYSRLDGPPYVIFAPRSAKPKACSAPGLTAVPVRPVAGSGRQVHPGRKVGVRVGADALTMSRRFTEAAYARGTIARLLDLTLGAVAALATDPHATVADLNRLMPEHACGS